ncbi:uncharacterized protein I206_102743 [Kwoniella pini CBS 10737]|uniref:G-protein coupled receptors family 1 profile domain-containing protein n=1 Tax=Kwoniella pini CBS 10737 TaxID=1296096 RepID=A0A1B9I680_9TREE|nr:uncharacterized protein I206_03098 [Kwoniella pini CBS 10737]OCF51033.1 hypothetical protein I206_03098 [Kwoniella pini CBS 10737]
MTFTVTQINATGASVISGLTLIAAAYLLWSLIKQGRGKLRVRLLLGMVISDLMLGCIALPPEILYLTRGPLKTGSAGCNGLAFLLTATLFSQHLWTLAIAFATFLLLTHPLSNLTSMFERYSWAVAPIIWVISILHSAVWYGAVGYVNNGSLCYYGSKGNGLDRDLVQFIPRAIVFIVIIVLYSRLFRFLRRPDTIQLSTQFMAGTQPDVSGPHGVEANNHNGGNKLFRPFKMTRGSSGNKDPVNPEAPWEALEFVTVGGGFNGRITTNTPLHTNTIDFTPTVPSGILLGSRPVSPDFVSPGNELKDPFSSTVTTSRYPSTSSEISGTSTKQTSGTDTYTVVTPELNYQIEPPTSVESTNRLITPTTIPIIQRHHVLSPVLSQGSKVDYPSDLGGNGVDEESLNDRLGVFENQNLDQSERRRSSLIGFSEEEAGGGIDNDRRPSGQTLKEFFQEYQVGGTEDIPENRGRGSAGSKGGQQLSASAYFNRQASLLMLYFPLAYMLVFSVSLVRLIYDMVHGQPTPVLSIMSNWLVLSVGLIDGAVYGIAELMVKAKVRRKMPEHMHSQG